MSDLRKLNPKLWDYVDMYTKRATLDSEAAVKRLVKRVLNKAGVMTWMPPARAYGNSGLSDIHCLKYGRFVAIETKFDRNTPTENQNLYGREVEEHGGVYVVINEKNVTERLFSVIRWYETGRWDGHRQL